MSESMDGRDQSDDGPKANYPVPGASSSQYSQPSYPFPIDAELTMPPHYPVPQYARQLEDAVPNGNAIDNGSVSDPNLNHQGADSKETTTDPALGMPYPSNQPPPSFAPPPTRANIDESPVQTQSPQAGDKRKRSKTSRACDECRRKKVRCDAPTEADGTPKTCTNCQKAGAVCEFERKPMKRGPSRGYIRELSERVEQVEQAQKQVLRQSMDAGMGVGFGPYPDTILPDAATSTAKRASSLNGHHPFAHSDFQRDRIPSSGAWGLQSSTASESRSRDRTSLAVAPDQAIPSDQSLPSELPESEKAANCEIVPCSWSPSEDSPSTTRRRLSVNYEHPFKMKPSFLDRYYQQIDPLFPLLPDADTVVSLVTSVPKLSNAFATVVEIFPYAVDKPDMAVNGDQANGTSNQGSGIAATRPRRAIPGYEFPYYRKLKVFLLSETRGNPKNRGEDENLVGLWTLLLFALSAERDIGMMVNANMDDDLSKTYVLRYCLRILARLRQDETDETAKSSIKDREQFMRIVTQAYNCACVLVRYHCLSIGVSIRDLFPENDGLIVDLDRAIPGVSPEASFIMASAKLISYVHPLLRYDPDVRYNEVAAGARKEIIEPLIQEVLWRFAAQLDKQNPIVQQVTNFVRSLLARVGNTTQVEWPITETNEKMLAGLTAEAASAQASHRYNPLEAPVTSVLVLTLCEILRLCSVKGFANIAQKFLDEIKPVIQNKSRLFHETYGYEWYFATCDPHDEEKVEKYRMNHWTDCLLRIIDETEIIAPMVPRDNDLDHIRVPAFRETAATGWANILANYCRNA
ncbi:hypothetical protein ABEF95_012261 [Exophiala dermatitidis]